MASSAEVYPGLCSKTSMIQIEYGIWVNLIAVNIGLAHGFSSVQIPQLNSPTSDIKVTKEEASWIASIITLFSPIGCIIGGILMDKFGRAVMIQCCQLPVLVGWIYTVIAKNAIHMIMARAILSLGCGFAMGPPRLFTTEISLPNMRGLLGAFPNMFVAFGICTQAALGLIYPWRSLGCICAGFSLTLFISYHFLTETPYFVLMRDDAEKAREALAKFRSKSYNFENEAKDLTEFKQENNIRRLSGRETLKALTTSSAYKPFVIVMVFITCGCLSGGPIVTFWTLEFLLAVNSSIDVYKGNFYIAFTRLVFSVITSALLYKTPRKALALFAVGGVTLTWFAMAVFLHVENKPNVGPEIFLILFTVFASIGYYMLPFLLMSELFPLQIKGTLTGISISVTCVEFFLTAKCFHILRDDLGMPKTMIMFTASSLFCFVYLYLFLPETKDLTLRQIERFFSSSPLVASNNAGSHPGRKAIANVIESESKKSVPLIIDEKPLSVTSVGKAKTDGKKESSSKNNAPNTNKRE